MLAGLEGKLPVLGEQQVFIPAPLPEVGGTDQIINRRLVIDVVNLDDGGGLAGAEQQAVCTQQFNRINMNPVHRRIGFQLGPLQKPLQFILRQRVVQLGDIFAEQLAQIDQLAYLAALKVDPDNPVFGRNVVIAGRQHQQVVITAEGVVVVHAVVVQVKPFDHLPKRIDSNNRVVGDVIIHQVVGKGLPLGPVVDQRNLHPGNTRRVICAGIRLVGKGRLLLRPQHRIQGIPKLLGAGSLSHLQGGEGFTAKQCRCLLFKREAAHAACTVRQFQRDGVQCRGYHADDLIFMLGSGLRRQGPRKIRVTVGMDGIGNGECVPGLKPDVQPRRIGTVRVDQQQRFLGGIVSFCLELVNFFLDFLLITLGIDLCNRILPQQRPVVKPALPQILPDAKAAGGQQQDHQQQDSGQLTCKF